MAVIDSYTTTPNNNEWLSGDGTGADFSDYGQCITGDGTTLDSCIFSLCKTGSPTGNMTAVLYAHTGTFGTTGKPTGSALATSDVVAASSLAASPSYADVTFTFSTPYTVAAGTNYCLCVHYVGSSSNYVRVGTRSSGAHAGNSFMRSWGNWNVGTANEDCYFIATHAAAVVPTVTTQAVSAVANTTATGNGNVTSDGGATITERGVCINTTGTPTTSDTKFTAAGTTGAFTASMTSLSESQRYYARAYAINSAGTAYGSEVNFITHPWTIYVDSADGNDSYWGTEQTNTGGSTGPLKTLTAVGALVLTDGDIIKFKGSQNHIEGYTLEMKYSGVTYTSYGTGFPVLGRGVLDDGSGWTESSGVYSKVISTVCYSLMEDFKTLKPASSTACTDGYWFRNGSTIYYKPTSGTPTAGRVFVEQGAILQTTADNITDVTVDGLKIISNTYSSYTSSGTIANFTWQNCYFLGKTAMLNMGARGADCTGLDVNNCTFNWTDIGVKLDSGDSAIRRFSGTINNNTFTNLFKYDDPMGVSRATAACAGSVTSGTFLPDEQVIQGTTNAAGYVVSAGATLKIYGLTGTSNNSNTWVGQTSSAVYTPTAVMGNPLDDLNAIYIQNPYNLTIENNDISGDTTEAANWWIQNAAITCTGIVFRKNYIHDILGYGLIAANSAASATINCEIYDNIIYNYGTGVGGVYAGIKLNGAQDSNKSKVYNNTMYNGSIGVWIASGASNYLVKNNLTKTMSYANVVSYEAPPGSTDVDYNCWGDTGNKFSYGLGDFRSFASWKSTYANYDANSINEDPLLVGDGSGGVTDFKFQASSPCRAAGTDVDLVTDYAGVTWGIPPSMGAYEYAANLTICSVDAAKVCGVSYSKVCGVSV